TVNLQLAYRLTGRADFLDAAVRQVDHLLGRNYYGRSQVTGLGYKPPQHPHHRPSVAQGRVWPGLLVGGSQKSSTGWQDSSDDYQDNEVAINWGSALAYAFAGFLGDSQGGTAWSGQGPPIDWSLVSGGDAGARLDGGMDAS